MLNVRKSDTGVSLIELLIGLAIFALLVGIGAPSFGTWIKNSQIRTAAETAQNGLQMTRTEAVKRNTLVRFQFTDTVDGNCTLSTTKANWVISLDDPTGKCADAPSDLDVPRIIQTRPAAEGTSNIVVAADQAAIVFNGLGRVTPTPAGSVNIDFSLGVADDCAANGGTMRCLRVTISAAGQVRTCDPALDVTNPRGC